MAKVLVAEDRSDMRDLIIGEVQGSSQGHRVDGVSDGEEALKALQRGVYTAVITDLEMDTSDAGIEVALAALKNGIDPSHICIATGAQLPGNDPAGDSPLQSKLRDLSAQGIPLFRKPEDVTGAGFAAFLASLPQN